MNRFSNHNTKCARPRPEIRSRSIGRRRRIRMRVVMSWLSSAVVGRWSSREERREWNKTRNNGGLDKTRKSDPYNPACTRSGADEKENSAYPRKFGETRPFIGSKPDVACRVVQSSTRSAGVMPSFEAGCCDATRSWSAGGRGETSKVGQPADPGSAAGAASSLQSALHPHQHTCCWNVPERKVLCASISHFPQFPSFMAGIRHGIENVTKGPVAALPQLRQLTSITARSVMVSVSRASDPAGLDEG